MLCSWRAQPDDAGRLGMFDPKLRPVLRPNALYYLRLLALSSFMLWMPLCLFFGAVFRRSVYIYRTDIEVVDLDQGPVGRQLTQSVLQIAAAAPNQQGQPRWRMRSDLASIADTREWVRHHGWAALVINSGASARLADAASGNTNTVYNPADAATIMVNTGRHPIIVSSFIQPALTRTVRAAQIGFSVAFTRQLGGLDQVRPQNIVTLATQPVAFSLDDDAPLSFAIAPISYLFSFLVGQLCVIGALIGWKMQSFSFFVKVKHTHVWLGAASIVLAWAIYIGMLGALAISAFRGPDYSKLALSYTVGRFFSLWFTTAMVLSAGGMWLLSWFVVLTPELLALASLSLVLPNVASTLTTVETSPRFFRWFYALPFYNGSMLYRFILSGAFPRIGLNVGVVLGDLCLCTAALWLTTCIRQYTAIRGISDIPGWYRGGIFFESPIPYYKDKKEPKPRSESIDERTINITDSADDATSFREGNLGV
ncbi:hypothetical protein GGH91_001016 [Coemansia sp. RSA 2671]|nr:hypothetical protein LPJ60_001433 [Coemansia sp. RSA 2675]KAJ2029251.1 hypothetical protein IWW57_001794 [Coemansia sp. S610]KAJ2349101.1 hypothetical protein GGH91_001016 [Coemansia sp. RSA 2671]